MEIKNIGVHHFAGNLTLDQLNAEHKARWEDMPSELRPDLYVGYNFVIWKDGSYTQCRYIGEETCAQKGHNFDTVSICLAGNFTRGIELPTEQQKNTLAFLAKAILDKNTHSYGLEVKQGTVINIKPENIFPHRILQPNHTECYGSALSDSWAREVIFKGSQTSINTPQYAPQGEQISKKMEIIRKLIALYQEQLAQLKRQGLGRIFGKKYNTLASCLDADVRG